MAGVALVLLLAIRRRDLARKVLSSGLVVLGGYLAVLLAASLLSEQKVLAPGQWKYFCEVDCHEAYSVVGVKTAKTLGPPAKPTATKGVFYVVTVKVWFDERTINPRLRLPKALLTPNPHVADVVDQSGKRYEVSQDGQVALEEVQGKSIAFTQPIRPGESYTSTLVFDLPPNVKNPRLYITTLPWLTWALIGHENSPFHQKVLFRLEPEEKQDAANAAFLYST